MAFLPYLIPKSWARLHQRACIKNYIWGIGLFYFSFNTFIQPEIRKFPAFAFPRKIHYDASRLLWLEAEPGTGDRKRRVDCGQGGQCEQWFSRRKKWSFFTFGPQLGRYVCRIYMTTSQHLSVSKRLNDLYHFGCMKLRSCGGVHMNTHEASHGWLLCGWLHRARRGSMSWRGMCTSAYCWDHDTQGQKRSAPLLNTDSSGNVACLRQEALLRTPSHGGPACKLLLIRTQPNS